MLKKMRNKFLILNMSIISVVMIATFVIIYSVFYSNIQSENQNKLLSLPVTHSETSVEQIYNGVSAETHVVRNLPSDYSLSFSIEVNEDGEVLDIQSYIDMSDETYYKAAELAWNNQDGSTIELDDKMWQYVISDAGLTHVVSEYGQQSTVTTINNNFISFLDVTASYNNLKQLFVIFLMVGIGMLIVIFFISLYFANRTIEPIVRAWEKQKQFVTDASHELKTPLAIIDANSDALLANEEDTIKNQKKWLEYIKEESDRMAKLINNLLLLAKAEDTSIQTFSASFDISAVVNYAILSMEAIVFEKDIRFTHSIEQDIMTKGDSEQLKQVIIILLDNAIKYTNKKGYISIALKKTKRQIVFSIENSGNGIKKADIPKLFDRFYRTDPSRTQENGGYGLGLSVAKAIMDRLGGEFFVESIENESTTFTFTIPL